MTIRARHDALFKFTFGEARHAASAIAAVLPPQVRQHIDFSAFELQPGNFVDVELKDRHTDLLYRTRLRSGGEVFVYILFEHQSTPDGLMPLRMLGYIVRIWWDFVRENPGQPLPPIVPVVLYHGEQPWTLPTSLAEMYGKEVVLSDFGDLLPSARFIVDDLTVIPDEALRARALTGLAHLTMGSLKHCRDAESLLNWLGSSSDALVEVWQAPNGLRAIEALTRYILTNNDVARQNVEQTFGDVLGQEAREVIVTTAQRLYNEGMEEGLEQGEELGLAKGAYTVFVKRFGPLEAAMQARFDALDRAGLEAIYDEIFTASSAEQLIDCAEAAQRANADAP